MFGDTGATQSEKSTLTERKRKKKKKERKARSHEENAFGNLSLTLNQMYLSLFLSHEEAHTFKA